MQSFLGIFTLLFCSLMVLSCSEHVPDKYEQLYINAGDSLKLYQSAPYLQKELAGNQKARDLLTLDYLEFKKKYDWNDLEMEELAEIIQGHVSIARNLQSFNPSND